MVSELIMPPKKVVYDNARSHFLMNFPTSLPIEQAYVHIGMYLGWIIEAELYSEFFADEASNQIFRFKRREISCTILSEIWDGYLGADLFSKAGNMFTYYYYVGGLYMKDYEKLLLKNAPSIYHIEDNWDNYEAMKTCIDMRFHDWRKMISVL